MMDITEEIVTKVAKNVAGKEIVNYQGTDIKLASPWKRISMIDAIKEATKIDFNKINTDEEAIKVAEEEATE